MSTGAIAASLQANEAEVYKLIIRRFLFHHTFIEK
jgi:hypothetical protein